MARPTADEFVAALRQVEDAGNVDAMAALYADDARTSNPMSAEPHVGVEGARQFWRAYRDSFMRIHSRFRAIVEDDTRAMLEWTSDCETATGVRASYGGVSIVETRDGRIARFAAYFDPAALGATSHAPRTGAERSR